MVVLPTTEIIEPIIFDKNNEFILNGFKLLYDEKYGVTIERLDKNESV